MHVPTIANNDWMRQYVHVTWMFKATLMRCANMHVYVCMVNLTQIKRRVWATHNSWRLIFTSTHWQSLYILGYLKKNFFKRRFVGCVILLHSDIIILCQANCTCTMYIGNKLAYQSSNWLCRYLRIIRWYDWQASIIHCMHVSCGYLVP